MILQEYFNYRNELLDLSKDDEGFIQESLILSQVLPSMLDAKLIDSGNDGAVISLKRFRQSIQLLT